MNPHIPHALHTLGIIALVILSLVSTFGALSLALYWAWRDTPPPERSAEDSCEP